MSKDKIEKVNFIRSKLGRIRIRAVFRDPDPDPVFLDGRIGGWIH